MLMAHAETAKKMDYASIRITFLISLSYHTPGYLLRSPNPLYFTRRYFNALPPYVLGCSKSRKVSVRF